jgi:hypothetical protein
LQRGASAQSTSQWLNIQTLRSLTAKFEPVGVQRAAHFAAGRKAHWQDVALQMTIAATTEDQRTSRVN